MRYTSLAGKEFALLRRKTEARNSGGVILAVSAYRPRIMRIFCMNLPA